MTIFIKEVALKSGTAKADEKAPAGEKVTADAS